MNDKTPDSFEQRAQALFERDVAELDAATRSKLNRARQRALAELDEPARAAQRWRLPVRQSAFAAIAIAALGGWALGGWLFVRSALTPERDVPVAAASEMEILLAEEELEFLEELEFYAWLEAQPEFEGLTDAADGAG